MPRPVALVLRALGVGDLLAAVPALRAIRRALPEHVVVLAAPRGLSPLVNLVDAVDLLHPAAGLEPLDHPSPDVAVNMHGCGPQSHRILARLEPRLLVAFRRDDLGVDGPEWADHEHEVVRWCRLVVVGLGVDTDPTDLGLRMPPVPAPVPGAVVIHPGAAHAARRWPTDRFAEVAGALARLGHPVVVTGSAAEHALADRVRREAGLPGSSLLAGHTSLDELAALVAEARLVVAGDTGIAHLATAYRTPSVVLFGPTPPSEWGPLQRGPHVVLWRGRGRGDPWAPVPDPSLLEITVPEVLEAATSLLHGQDAAGDAPELPAASSMGDVLVSGAGSAVVPG